MKQVLFISKQQKFWYSNGMNDICRIHVLDMIAVKTGLFQIIQSTNPCHQKNLDYTKYTKQFASISRKMGVAHSKHGQNMDLWKLWMKCWKTLEVGCWGTLLLDKVRAKMRKAGIKHTEQHTAIQATMEQTIPTWPWESTMEVRGLASTISHKHQTLLEITQTVWLTTSTKCMRKCLIVAPRHIYMLAGISIRTSILIDWLSMA